MSDEKIAATLKTAYGISGPLQRLAGENENYLLEAAGNKKYVVKLADTLSDRDRILLEHETVEAVFNHGIDVLLPRLVPDLNGNVVTFFKDNEGSPRPGRLLEFVPGDAWSDKAPASDELLETLGELVARMARAMSPLDIPAARISHTWDLAAAGSHWSEITAVEDLDRPVF